MTDLRPTLALAQPRLRAFLPGLLLGLLASGSAVALLATAAWLITRAAEQPPILHLGFAIVGVRAFALGRASFRYLERLASHDAAFRALGRLRAGILERIIPIAPVGLTKLGRGDLMTRLVADVDQLQDLPLRVVQPLATSLVIAALSVVGAWLVLPEAALVLVVALVLAAIVGTIVNARLAERAQGEIAPLRAEVAGLLLDFANRIDVLVAYGAVEERQRVIAEADGRLRAARVRRALGAGVVTATVVLLTALTMAGMVLVAAPALETGALNGPLLALLVFGPIAVFEAFGMVPLAVGAWRQVEASARRVADVVPEGVPAEIPVAPEHPAALPAGHDIELRGVSARWPGADLPAIQRVSLTLAAGECLLVTGPSGSGKSTLANVLVRFLEHEGSFTLGGVDVHTLAPDDVRRVVGLCEQTPHLFDESIRQNLLFARPEATDDELLAALASVGLEGWAAERGGLDAPVGERGILVSGGQAQRIAVARALLAEFPVLVLDEPTANVDADRADELMRDLLTSAAASDRAVLVISHTPIASELVTRTLRLG